MNTVSLTQTPVKLEEIVSTLENTIVRVANELNCKTSSPAEFYYEFDDRYEYNKILTVNVVNRKYTEEIANKIADAVQTLVEEISRKLDLFYDFGGDDFALYDVLLQYDEFRTIEVAVRPDYWRAEIEIAIYVKHYIPNIIFTEKQPDP